jgi:hypothetical protein
MAKLALGHEGKSACNSMVRSVLSKGCHLLLLIAVGCSSASSCGGSGGGGSCAACRESCERAAIPPSRCNCDGCTPP